MILMETSIEAVRKNLDYLEHYGVKGQRWGVRRTPEQLGHILQKKNARHYGKYNAAVRKISKIQGDKSISQLSEKERKKMIKATDLAKKYMERIQSDEAKYTKKIDKATAKQEAKETKLAEKESEKQAKEKERTDKIKEEIYKNHDWKKAYENKELFSNQELNDLANRVNAEKRLKSELSRGEGLDKLADNIKKVSTLAGAGLDAYDKYTKIKGIFEEGKKESAYKEIRQLMADGKNADVIKKSIGISDKDVETFNKRKSFLDNLRRDIPQKQQSVQTEQSNKSNKNENEKEKKETFKNIKSTLSNGLKEMADETISKEQKKQAEKINKNLYEFVNSNRDFDNNINVDITRESGSWNKEPTLKGTVEGTGNSFKTNQNNKSKINDIIDVPYTEAKESMMNKQKDKYLPLVLNDIGDFKLSDFKQ